MLSMRVVFPYILNYENCYLAVISFACPEKHAAKLRHIYHNAMAVRGFLNLVHYKAIWGKQERNSL